MKNWKEKRLVIYALSKALDALFHSLEIEAIQEDTLATLKHKIPAVVAETAKFLGNGPSFFEL